MRKFFLIFNLILCVFFISGLNAIYAQEKTSFYVGASAMNCWNQLDESHTEDLFIGNVSVDYDNSFGLKFRGGLILNEYFTVEGQMEYVIPFESEMEKGFKTKIDVFTIGGNAKCTLPVKEYFVPYFLFGLGIMNSYEKISGPEFRKKTDWGIGSRIAIGTDLIYQHNYSVGIEMEHVLGFGNVDHIQYSNFSLNAAYRF